MRVGIVVFGVADLPHSGVRSRQGHSGSNSNRTGSRDRPAGRSRDRPAGRSRDTPKEGPGDRSGGVLRDRKVTAAAQ